MAVTLNDLVEDDNDADDVNNDEDEGDDDSMLCIN